MPSYPTGSNFARCLFRKKTFHDAAEESQHTKLSRCLTTFDLVALGVGSTLGAGVYVLTGTVAKDKTGPAVVLSFVVAAIASVMAGLCYAEFGARVPKAGSAYVYSYVSVGELWAFVIGWNLILEYMIGTSSLGRAWSENFDMLIGGRFKKFSLTYLHMETPGFAEYPDVFAFAVIILLTVILCFGVKESATFSKIFTGINILVILFVMIYGALYANIENWNITPEDLNEYFEEKCASNDTVSGNATSGEEKTVQVGHSTVTQSSLDCHSINGTYDTEERFGTGGFFPYGFSGVMSGAATCFFGFIGFDVIATTGEEVKNPQRAIPISIVVSLLVVLVAYLGISIIVTLIVPYYVLDVGAPLPQAFAHLGVDWAVYPLAIGATCALSSSLMGGLFPMPRVVYAMAQDGLIFRSLANVNKRFKTPILATAVSGFFAAFMVLIFDLKDLVDMMSIGTLLAYTLVAICVLLLRYQPDESQEEVPTSEENDASMPTSSSASLLLNIRSPSHLPTIHSGRLVYICTMIIGVVTFVLCVIAVNISRLNSTIGIALMSICAAILVIVTIVIIRQPQSQTKLSFTVPFVPVLPVLSTVCNVYLMCELSTGTWIRFCVWMALGFVIYFGYGIRQSHAMDQNQNSRSDKVVMITGNKV